MDISLTTALLPIERSPGLALKTTENHRTDLPAKRRKAGDFIFLGYGPGLRDELYNSVGKPVVPRRNGGSVVDLYV